MMMMIRKVIFARSYS